MTSGAGTVLPEQQRTPAAYRRDLLRARRVTVSTRESWPGRLGRSEFGTFPKVSKA